MEKKNEPTIKADEFVEYEDTEKPESFTNFQELNAKFEVLKDIVQELTEILRENNLTREQVIHAPYFEIDDVYKRLEEEDALSESSEVKE